MSLLELFIEVDNFHKMFGRWAAQQQLPDIRAASHSRVEAGSAPASG